MAERTIDWLQRLGLFLDKFSDCFVRTGHELSAKKYLSGLLSSSERKNILGLGQDEHGSAGYQALQHFVSDAAWKAKDVWDRLRKMNAGDRGVLVLDDTGFRKKGRHSVGVDRQYSGTLEQVGNCQVAVSSVLLVGPLTFPMGMDLYLPEKWTESKERRAEVGIPVGLRFQPKWQIALEQVRTVMEAGVEIECVVGDAGYGHGFEFRQSLDELGLLYVVGIKSDATAFAAGEQRERAPVRDLARRLPEGKWRALTWREGTKGALREQFAMIQLRQAGAKAAKAGARPITLLCERSSKATRLKDWKYYFTNIPWGTPMNKVVDLAHSRWAIEQSYQHMKEELGLDHFEGRGFAGFHRHVVLTALSYSFLQLERQHGKSLLSLPMVRNLVKRFIGMVTILTNKKLWEEFQQVARIYPNTS